MMSPIHFNSQNAMSYIVEQIPEFLSYWKRHKEYWMDTHTTIGIDMSTLCDFTRDTIQQNDRLKLRQILQIIEDFIIFGDDEVNYAATMMFLENLIYESSHDPNTVPYSSYIPLLGSKSKEFCCELDLFWATNTPGLWKKNERVPHVSFSYQETGSIAAALKAETRCIVPPGNKTHLQKCKDNKEMLCRWLDLNPTALPQDRDAAKDMIHDLQEAIYEAEFIQNVLDS